MTKNNSIRITVIMSLLCGACAGDSGQTESDRNGTQTAYDTEGSESRVLLLRDGVARGTETLAGMNAGDGVVTVSIVDGPATFASGSKVESVSVGRDGRLTLPSFDVGMGLDSTLELSARGSARSRLRVRGIAGDRWQRALDVLASHPEARLEQGETYVLIDELAVGSDDRGTKLELSDEPGAAPTYSDDKAVCVRVPWGPGKVNWASSNPAGAGFSVKPESQWALIWAAAPSQDIDGIYRRSWGCNYALKVADSCTASVTTGGSISCCCNAAMEAIGHTCSYVNPAGASVGWPPCPL